MLLQFKVVADDSLWCVDTDKLRYARLTKPVVEVQQGDPVIEEYGELHLRDPLVKSYILTGRSRSTEGPGDGLCSVVVLLDVIGTELIITMTANVPVKEPACIKPISSVRCVVLGQAAYVN